MHAVEALLARIDALLPAEFTESVPTVLVGGVAVHVHTAARVSGDLEAVHGRRLLLPPDLAVTYIGPDGHERLLHLDTNFAAAIALLHPEAEREALPLGRVGRLDVRVLTPIDLAVSKIGRWLGNDEADVRELAARGLLNATALDRRTRGALGYFIGDLGRVELNLGDALEIVRTCLPGSKS
ncbi:MAG: hypothetical protein HZA54_00075 [Planctomycetes bacterium]|nr:hypothetical protein [Planctomycetota bacterium]